MKNKILCIIIALSFALAPPAHASQSAPTETAALSGLAFRLSNNAGKTAIISQHKGSTPPSYATAGLIWLDDAAMPWLLKQYDGADWITLGAVNATANTFTPYYGAAPLRLLNYAADTGGANVYAVAPSPALSAYAAGVIVTLRPSHANTGASTLAVNGLSAIPIKNADGSDLASGQLNVNGFYMLIDDGTNFVLVGGASNVTESGISLSDVTTNNASTSAHGFLKKLSGNAAQFMDGAGAWSTPSGGGINYQVFTASGTWTKPSSGTIAKIECWGGGGGGDNSSGSGHGGGGGGYNRRDILFSSLGATETVTIAAGGIYPDGDGGNSTFGSWLTAYGGASVYSNAGGGGGVVSAATTTTGGDPSGGTKSTTAPYAGGNSYLGGGGGGGDNGGSSVYGGGGGGDNGNGGSSVYGGGGGVNPYGTAGISIFGGKGGKGSTAPTAPGGGGGSTTAGARGECRVTVY